MALDLTIIVPAFNEAHRLGAGMERFDAAVAEGAVDLRTTEVVVVDDGSRDRTGEVATKLLAPLPHHRVLTLRTNGGKGAAVRAGITAARGAHCAYMDADMAIDPRAIPLLLDGLRTSDVAIGSRALDDSMVESRYVLRSLMGGLFNRMVTTGTGLGLHDTQCGFKAFRTPAARLLFHLVRIDRFAFDVEVLVRARTLGLTITEVPVQWKHVPGSTVHPLHDSLGMLADVYGSRLGLRAVPPVPALAVVDRTGAASPDERWSRVAGAVEARLPERQLPIVSDRGAVLVLLPLLDDNDLAAVTGDLIGDLRPLTVTRRSLPASAIRALGPLSGRLTSPAPAG
jgi:glycosyltransferase involved in cell wall biosynthesis